MSMFGIGMEKGTRMSTNKPMLSPVVLLVTCGIFSNSVFFFIMKVVLKPILANNWSSLCIVSQACTSAVQSKNAVCANIKHNRYFHSTCNFSLIHSHDKRLYGHMFDMVDTTFSY